MPFAGATAPVGWLVCNTATGISTTTYAALFAAIGYAWGNPGGGLFNIPDLRGRFTRGRNANGSVVNEPVADAAARTACNSGGNTAENVGSVQSNQTNAHGHPIGVTSQASGQKRNNFTFSDGVGNSQPPGTYPNMSIIAKEGIGGGSVSYTNPIVLDFAWTTDNTGGNETRANNAYVNYIIKY
jgi:microcystin-dependent protein